VSFERPVMFRCVSPAAMERATSCFKRVRVASSSLREFQSALVLDDVKNLVNWEVQGCEGDGAFGLHRHRGSVLLGS